MGSKFFARIVCLALVSVCCVSAKLVSFDFGPFNDSAARSFSLVPPAEISANLLRLTPKSATHQSSRAMLNVRFKLWNETHLGSPKTRDTTSVSSFNSSFTVVLSSADMGMDHGEGIAFLIGPDTLLPSGSDGPFLGLTNATLDGLSTNHILAVVVKIQSRASNEFEGQIRIQVNGTKVLRTSQFRIPRTRSFKVWIEYGGDSRDFEVRVAGPSPQRQQPRRALRADIKVKVDIRDIISEHSYFGFSASTGNVTAQTYSISTWNLAVNDFSDNDSLKKLEELLSTAFDVVMVLAVFGATVMLVYHMDYDLLT